MKPLLVVCLLHTFIIARASSANATESALPNSTYSNFTLPPHLVGKHESLFTCPSFELGPEHYELLPNGSVRLEIYHLTINESFYILKNETVVFCISFPSDEAVEMKHIALSSYITLIGLLISMIGLFLHLVVFCLVPDLRNLPGWNLATFCMCLFISYLLLLIIGNEEVSNHREVCAALGSVTHFFLLSSFLWMSIISCDVFVSLLRATGSFRTSSTNFKRRKFVLYCICAFGIALLFNVFGVLADTLDILPNRYKPEFEKLCWFNQRIPLLIFFGGPVIILSCLNFFLFGASACIIHANKRKSDQDAQQPVLKRRYFMYFRLSVIMGVTWITGIAASIASMAWLWYVFVLLNTLQGFFIFIGFTCSKKVKNYFRQKLVGARKNYQPRAS